jgi:TolB protein
MIHQVRHAATAATLTPVDRYGFASAVAFATLTLVAAVAVLATVAMLVGPAPAAAAVPYVTESPLASGPSTQSAAQIDASGAATWEDDASGDFDVWLRSLWGSPLQFALGPSAQRRPVTNGSTVVYEDDRGTDADLYAASVSYDWTQPSPSPSFTEQPVSVGAGEQLDPAIGDGFVVVFEDAAAGNSNIAMVDLDAGTGRQLTTNRADQVDPAIEGDNVVYADHRNGNWDIYLYNLKTKVERRLTTSKADQTAPQIGNGIVVYQDHRNGNWDIYAYVLKARVEKRLTSSKADQTAPWIDRSGHKDVVYQDTRNGDSDVYLYDLTSRVEKRLTDDPADQTAPSIAKDRVVWTDVRAGDPDAYIGDLDYPRLTLGGPGSPPRYNATVSFNGELYVAAGAAVGARVIKTGAGGTRTFIVSDSGFGFSVPRVQRKITVRCSFKGDATRLPANPVVLTVKPKALLTRPSFTKAPYAAGQFPVFGQYVVKGYLKPHHAAGSRAVTIKVYGKSSSSGSWVLKKSVAAKVRDYRTYSAYNVIVNVGLPIGFSAWKVQAVHSDADHAQTLSPFSAVR